MTKLRSILSLTEKEINTIPTIDNLFLYKVVNEHNPLFLGKELKKNMHLLKEQERIRLLLWKREEQLINLQKQNKMKQICNEIADLNILI